MARASRAWNRSVCHPSPERDSATAQWCRGFLINTGSWWLCTDGTEGKGERGKSLHKFLIMKYLLGFDVCGRGECACVGGPTLTPPPKPRG